MESNVHIQLGEQKLFRINKNLTPNKSDSQATVLQQEQPRGIGNNTRTINYMISHQGSPNRTITRSLGHTWLLTERHIELIELTC
jgi:hypothetical protein